MPTQNEWHVRSGLRVLRHLQALHRRNELNPPIRYGSEFYKSANISMAFLRLTEVSLGMSDLRDVIGKPSPKWV